MSAPWAGRTPTPDEWRDILEQHARWMRGDGGSRAVLTGADLTGADLTRAVLRGAVLTRAVLTGADLTDADLRGVIGALPIYRHQIVPEAGAFTAWKQLVGNVIAQLEIPADAGRIGGLIGRKCRAERAVVVALSEGTEGRSLHDGGLVYRVGETVTPTGGWDPSPLVECSDGIHFYITRREAEEHR